MTLLASIRGPEDLKRLAPEQLPQLAGEIRDLLVAAVSKNGGHLGPNLGAVELTQQQYLELLGDALRPGPEADLPAAYAGVLAEAEGVGVGDAAGGGVPVSAGKGASSPGKLIAQSLTHTS